MHTTRSDMSENVTTSHKTAVREYLRDHRAVTNPADLTAGHLSEKQVAA